MRKTSEMYVASGMQHMVQIRPRNACLATKSHSVFLFAIKSCFFGGGGALGVESPHGGAMYVIAGGSVLVLQDPLVATSVLRRLILVAADGAVDEVGLREPVAHHPVEALRQGVQLPTRVVSGKRNTPEPVTR